MAERSKATVCKTVNQGFESLRDLNQNMKVYHKNVSTEEFIEILREYKKKVTATEESAIKFFKELNVCKCLDDKDNVGN